MKIGFANDHSAIDMKAELIPWLEEQGYEVVNFGTDSRESTDYPIWGEKLANAVAAKEVDLGLGVCGTGLGIGLACNKVRGIRAAICSEPYTARYSRLHNNCNILCFGARVIGVEMAKMMITEFLQTEFEGGRHARRVGLIMDIEERNFNSEDR